MSPALCVSLLWIAFIQTQTNRKSDATIYFLCHRLLHEFSAHESPVMAMDLSPDGQTIITGSSDKAIHRTSLRYHIPADSAERISDGLSRVEDSVSCSSFTSQRLDSADLPKEGTAASDMIHHMPSLILTLTVPLNSNAINSCILIGTSSIKYRCDGRLLVSGHWDNSVRVWEAKTSRLKPLAVLNHHRDCVFAVDIAPTGKEFLSGSKDGTIAVWDLYADNVRRDGVVTTACEA
jgi:WD40 repeat protein